MTLTPERKSRIELLATKLLEGALSMDESDELSALLISDSDVRRYYLQTMELAVSIQRYFHQADQFVPVSEKAA